MSITTLDTTQDLVLFRALSIEEKRKQVNKMSLSNIHKLISADCCHDLEYDIFNRIYYIDDFKDYVVFLLQKGLIGPRQLTHFQIEHLATTDWGCSYLLANPNILNNIYYAIEQLVANDNFEYSTLFDAFSACNDYTKLCFAYYSICYNRPLSDQNIADLLNSCHYSLPDWFINDDRIKPVIERNFNLFFNFESKQKMAFINMFRDYAPPDVITKYQTFLKLYNLRSEIRKQVDFFLSSLILVGEEDKLLACLTGNVSYLDSGTTTHVYCIEDKVLKLNMHKYCPDTVKDLFLIAPTQAIKITSKKHDFDLAIEIQDNLSKTRHGKTISKHDVRKFLKELDKLGYYTDDPNNLDLKNDNFGYLNDYHDANMTGVDSYEELPKWFKKRPIVLYDIDKVYKKTYREN